MRIGPFLDETNGKDAETTLTIAQADVRLSKAGGDFAPKNDATSCTHDEIGYYTCPLNTTDTSTLGMLKLAVHESGALPVWHTWMVVPANVWDSLFGTDKLQVDCRELGDANLALTTQMKADVNAEADTALGDYDALVPADLPANFADLSISATTGLVNILQAAADKVWGTAARALTDKAGFTISGTKTTLDDLNDLDAAGVNAEVDTALSDIDLDHLIQVAAGAENPTVDSYLDQILNKNGSQTFDPSTDSLEAIKDTAPLGTAMRGTDNAALASVCTEARLAELAAANLPADVDAILADTGTDGVVLANDAITAAKIAADAIGASEFAQAAADKVWATAARALTDKADFALSAASRAAIWDEQEATLSISFETLMYRIFTLASHKMNVTDADGSAALRNAADSGNIATGSITDDDTTTVRAAWAWS